MDKPKSYDLSIVDFHEQKYHNSCIPSSIEIVLKLLGKVGTDYYDLQNDWGNEQRGTFSDFDRRTIGGLTFQQLFCSSRGSAFPFAKLFNTIDAELNENRLVIISLSSTGGWHMYVIVENKNDDYLAVSKSDKHTISINDVKERVYQMQGTDILIYRT